MGPYGSVCMVTFGLEPSWSFALSRAAERAVEEKAPALSSLKRSPEPRAQRGRGRIPSGVGLSMEGTSGAADRALLRGRVREAALNGEGSAKAGPSQATLWVFPR